MPITPSATPPTGLTSAEAAARLAGFGPNRIEQVRSRTLWQIVLSTFREPMFGLLIAAAGLYVVLGDLGEGAFLVAGAGATVGLVIFQEARGEQALAALRRLAEPFARVIRDGAEQLIPAAGLVPGDIFLTAEGERLPADAVLIGGDALTVDESVLTGEAVPVSKRPADDVTSVDLDTPAGGDDSPLLFAGAMVVRGQGVAWAARTGATTRFGRIGASLAAIEPEQTLLQRSTGKLVSRFGVFSLVACALVLLAYGLVRRDWTGGALAGITLGIAMVPEEFPMVLAIFLSLGAWRLAQHKVLVRRPAVIETLGAASLLCVDKTGTLTENRMKVAALWRDGLAWSADRAVPMPQTLSRLLRIAALGSAVRPVDPMDRAVREADQTHGSAIDETEPLRTYPLRPERLAFIQVWPRPDGGVLLAAKGAPEAISRLCRLDAGADDRMHEEVARLAGRGWRVLAVASAERPADDGAPPEEVLFVFCGLVAFEDPVRADVPAALAEARTAGVKVAMITGDYPATALEIARAAGIDTTAGVLTGDKVARLSPTDLAARIADVRVFARIAPDQKLTLVQAFKAIGEVVAMTGDGVNDAPALESAHIGIAMGRQGTDVAREAADIVLLDDRFASIVAGVRLGRRIFANLRKALTYVMAVHVPIAGLALLPILFGLPQLLFPAHVVVLELVIDPVCSIVFESEPSDAAAMRRPPRDPRETPFGYRQVAFGMLEGLLVLAASFGFYLVALRDGLGEPQARAAVFLVLVVANLTLAISSSVEPRGRVFDRRHLVFWGIAGAAALVLGTAVYAPFAQRLFQFATLPAGALLLALVVAAAAGAGPRLTLMWWQGLTAKP
jgi:Ca2+-transporting ATPase